MRAILISTLAAVALGGSAPADELPAIFEKPFLGCFVGFAESRDFEFALGSDGTGQLFFKKDRARLSTHGTEINFQYILEERPKGKPNAKWVNRTMQDDGFATTDKETVTPEMGKPVTFTATFTGDTRVEITHVFTKDGVIITNKIVEKKTDNEMRVGVRVVVGDLFRHIKEELEDRELKSKIKDSEIRVWPVGGRGSSGEKIEMYEEIVLQEEFPKGARKFSLESDRIGDRELILSTEKEDLGVFVFKQTKLLYHGFPVTWYPDPAKIDDKACRLVVEVK